MQPVSLQLVSNETKAESGPSIIDDRRIRKGVTFELSWHFKQMKPLPIIALSMEIWWRYNAEQLSAVE